MRTGLDPVAVVSQTSTTGQQHSVSATSCSPASLSVDLPGGTIDHRPADLPTRWRLPPATSPASRDGWMAAGDAPEMVAPLPSNPTETHQERCRDRPDQDL
jgi:hypothetical protein